MSDARLYRFEEIPLYSFFLHNDINYRKISDNWAEKPHGRYGADRVHYFEWSTEVWKNN